jgi:Alkaline phosphatase PhoX
MRFSRRGIVLAVVVVAAVAAGAAIANQPDPGDLTGVANANPKVTGFPVPNVTSPELQLSLVAQGSMLLDGGTTDVPYYGYDGNGPLVPAFGSNFEASKTEPDKNTYLVFKDGLKGLDPQYNYGTHFLFQGHETGTVGYITRINLDADAAHRVTLIGTQTTARPPVNLKTIDGSMWDPWAQRLLYTTESGSTSSVYQTTADYPSSVVDITKYTGRGAFEGVQNDDRGNLYLAEDAGGKTGSPVASSDPTFSTYPNAFTKQPNSFIYRFVPTDPTDLTKGGEVQALQVLVNNTPVTFTMPTVTPPATQPTAQQVADAANADISGANSAGYVALHTYGTSYATKWITIDTTSSSTTTSADDNAKAKAAGATPFKRPENGGFRPGSHFTEFYFDETGDTDNRTCAGGGPAQNPNWAACAHSNQTGGWGSIFKVVQSPTSDNGTISVLYNGDQTHAGFDNTAFFSKDDIAFVEDAGDTLHTQRNGLDSAWMFDVRKDYSNGAQPVRFIAEGRDTSATIDSALVGTTTPAAFRNEGDNEITGIYVSDGDPNTNKVLGTEAPQPFHPDGHWRAFWTQQHGDNYTWELIPANN